MLLLKLEAKGKIKLDFFHLQEDSDSLDDIYNTDRYIPTLNNYSRFLVTFDDATTISKGISTMALGYIFSIYREIKGSNQLIFISRFSGNYLWFIDYNVSNDTTYNYYIFKEDSSAISETVISNDATTCWDDWSIVDLIDSGTEGLYYTNGDVWKLNLNLSSSAKKQNVNSTTYGNLTRYPKISTGITNYSSGSISALLGNISKIGTSVASYIEPTSKLEEWNEFCANGHPKLLKDRKGNVMLVSIVNTTSQIADESKEQVTTISFDWVEIGKASEIAVIS